MPSREEILTAADKAVREVGMHQVTTKQIASIAGCSEGSIYNHFANKTALLACAVSQRMAMFPAYATSLPERAGQRTVGENLHEFARLAIEFFHQILPHLAGMLAEPAEIVQHARDIDGAGHGPRWVLRAMTDYLDRERELGRVHAHANTRGSAAALLGGCLQHVLVSHGWGAEIAEVSAEAHVVDVVEAVLAGLVAASDAPARYDRQES